MLKVILSVVVRIFSNSFANAFQKNLVAKNSSSLVTCATYLFLSLLCLPFLFLINWLNFSAEFWFYVCIANILCVVSAICLVQALKTGELSVLSSINSYKCVVGLIVGIIILGEIPSVYGIIGLFLIVWESWFVIDTTEEKFSITFFKRKDVILRVVAMVLAGIEAVFLKKIILISSFEISFILWCVGGFLCSLPFVIISKAHINFDKNNFDIFQFIILAICIGLMQFSTNYVFSVLNVGLALALFQLSTIVNLFIGYKIFQEHDIWKKFAGMVIMLIGSAFILLLNG